MAIADVIHDHMIDIMDEITENYMQRLINPRIEEICIKMFAEMHNAISQLDWGIEHCTIEQSRAAVENTFLQRRITFE